MGKYFSFHIATICAILAITGCVPVPINTVPLHFREDRPVTVESAPLENGAYALPTFDSTGNRLAVYDSGSDSVKVLRSSDLSLLSEVKPKNRPVRLYFSPRNNFLIIQTLLKSSIGSVRNSMAWEYERVEVWDLKNGRLILNTGCTSVPYLLESYFSADEAKFSILCENGMQQCWETTSWQSIENLPRPHFWGEILSTNEAVKSRYTKARSSMDGRFIALRFFLERSSGSNYKSYITRWDRNTGLAHEIPFGCRYGQLFGCCDFEDLPFQSLSNDGNRIAVICAPRGGYSIRVWDYSSGKEVDLEDARFGIFSGPHSQPHVEGVALSPDGRYLAVAVLNLDKALLVTPFLVGIPLSRSDLRLYSLDQHRELIAIPIEKLLYNGIDVTFSADSSMLAVAGKRLRIYRLKDLITKPH
jgi:WD40 repeat protein